MTLSSSNNYIMPRSHPKQVTLHNVFWTPRPFLMESNLKLSKIKRLHYTTPDALPEPTSQLIHRIGIKTYQTNAVCFVFYIHLMDLSERDIPVIGRSELIWTRTRVKINCRNLSCLEMTPCLYTGVQHERVHVKLIHYSIN